MDDITTEIDTKFESQLTDLTRSVNSKSLNSFNKTYCLVGDLKTYTRPTLYGLAEETARNTTAEPTKLAGQNEGGVGVDNFLGKKKGPSISPQKTHSTLGKFRRHHANYKRNAFKRNLSFSLTPQQFISLVQSDCFYCDQKPSPHAFRFGRRRKPILISVNGIDRIDAYKGYELENVVPCCSICNYAKSYLSLTEFIIWLSRISKNLTHLISKSKNYAVNHDVLSSVQRDFSSHGRAA